MLKAVLICPCKFNDSNELDVPWRNKNTVQKPFGRRSEWLPSLLEGAAEVDF